MMGMQTELLGRELARQIHMLAALKQEKKETMKEFGHREETILKEINRLALDVRTGQSSLYPDEKTQEGR